MLGISTEWMPDPEQGFGLWLGQVKELGVTSVELGYKITRDQIAQAQNFLKDLGMNVCSIHNFCPPPNDEPIPRHASNYYRMSSLDEHERAQAVKWTNSSVDTARELGASAVVIHAGTLDFEDERSPELFRLYVEGKQDSDEFRIEKDRILTLREAKKGPHVGAIVKCLKEVMPYAQDQGIKIGLETRYYPLEIPNFEEIGYFLNLFRSLGMGYWHDVGHCEMNSRLGIAPHEKFLETYKDDLIGVHLHGMDKRRDHLAPFQGDFDLEKYLPYFQGDIIRVIEPKSFVPVDQIKLAVEKLNKSFEQ